MNINANYVPPAHMLHPNMDPVTQENPVPAYKSHAYYVLKVRVPAPQDMNWGDKHRSPAARKRTLERPAYERMTNLWSTARSMAGEIGIVQNVQHFNQRLHSRMEEGTVYSLPWDYADNKAAAYELLSPVARLVGYTLALDDWGIHPAVLIALKEASPISVRMLFCQAPRKSREDGINLDKIVYSKSYDALVRGATTRTTVGRYLTRMFPTLSQDRIRDISALVGAKRTFGITTDMGEMLSTLDEGPKTCMTNNEFAKHPYRVYDPSLGWGLAYGESTEAERSMYHWYGACACRALVNVKTKKFVRCFGMASSEDGTSPDSDELRVWLLSQGFTKEECWSGHEIKRIEYCNDLVMPYIDGENQRIYQTRDGRLFIGNGSRFIGTADETGGTLDGGNEPDWQCCDCGGDQYDDDCGYWVGRHEEDKVCADCIDEYRMVSGRKGNEYYVRKDCSVQVGDDWYDEDYLDDNGIVTCAETDEYVHKDDASFCEWHNDYVKDSTDMTELRSPHGDIVLVCTDHLDSYLGMNEGYEIIEPTPYAPRPLTSEERAAQEVLL